MKILAIDTSSKAASVSMSDDKKIVGEFFINSGLTHSETILPMIEDFLKIIGQSVDDIDLLAVTNGPGSFTGLRIGLSTVKGLAFERNIPCLGISTLEALACNLVYSENLIVPVMDARRNQVYTATYLFNDLKITTELNPTTLIIDEIGDYLLNHRYGQDAILVGDGAELCYNKLKEKLPKLNIAPQNLLHQRASSIITACYLGNHLSDTISEEFLLPDYLRIPQAERELTEK